MSDKVAESLDRLEKIITSLTGMIAELVGDMQIIRMKQAMMADRIRKVSIKVRDYAPPQDQHGPSIPAQDDPLIGARAVQRKLEEKLSARPDESMAMPRCTDCEYSYRKPFSPWTCIHPSIAATDPVTGAVLPAVCFRARLTDGPCGPNGRGFKRKTK